MSRLLAEETSLCYGTSHWSLGQSLALSRPPQAPAADTTPDAVGVFPIASLAGSTRALVGRWASHVSPTKPLVIDGAGNVRLFTGGVYCRSKASHGRRCRRERLQGRHLSPTGEMGHFSGQLVTDDRWRWKWPGRPLPDIPSRSSSAALDARRSPGGEFLPRICPRA